MTTSPSPRTHPYHWRQGVTIVTLSPQTVSSFHLRIESAGLPPLYIEPLSYASPHVLLTSRRTWGNEWKTEMKKRDRLWIRWQVWWVTVRLFNQMLHRRFTTWDLLSALTHSNNIFNILTPICHHCQTPIVMQINLFPHPQKLATTSPHSLLSLSPPCSIILCSPWIKNKINVLSSPPSR